MVAVLSSSLLAARATDTAAAGNGAAFRDANGNARVAADIGFARPARDPDLSVTSRTLFEAQRIGSGGASPGAASPAVPGLDPFAVIDGARLAAQAAENGAGIASAAAAAALLDGALDGISEIETLLERMERLAADASLTDLDAPDDYEPPAALSDQDRARLNAEFAALRDEIDALAADTVIGGVAVLGGFSFAVAVGGGVHDGDSLTVGLESARPADLAAGFVTADITTLANATVALASVQAALDTLGGLKTQARSGRNRLAYAAGALDAAADVIRAARADRLTPAPALAVGRDVANGLLAQRGITDPPAGLGIDLILLRGFAGIALPEVDDPDPLFDLAAAGPATPGPAAPAPKPAFAAAAPEPAQTGQNLSVSV